MCHERVPQYIVHAELQRLLRRNANDARRQPREEPRGIGVERIDEARYAVVAVPFAVTVALYSGLDVIEGLVRYGAAYAGDGAGGEVYYGIGHLEEEGEGGGYWNEEEEE
eukprot:CAMPEP_0181132766 /NCGR_PEP_ID=MMETSP1071-20121207/31172_1 /TAXON_ID=35127 /ORGANISM="Thalassiosira sp., Strain NH16" /LENGTH=109 /DNA_ID=CAMNT_0023219125 /DNA_START=50 /DNA_END=376 /DNA_ORIENTATION=-